MTDARAPHPLAATYDALWEDSAPAVRDGRAALDPWVMRKDEDARRGVTLLARPAPPVAERLAAFAAELRAIEPAQYYHPRADLHLTVLSLFTATVDHAPHLVHVDAYRAAVAEASEGVAPFTVDAIGVTLSTGAVLVQGYPRDGTLDALRARLRAVLAARGLGGAVDQRYRLETAHTTLVRFAAPLDDPPRFVAALAAARRRHFGTSVVSRLELGVSDWYQSSGCTRPLGSYTLGASTAA